MLSYLFELVYLNEFMFKDLESLDWKRRTLEHPWRHGKPGRWRGMLCRTLKLTLQRDTAGWNWWAIVVKATVRLGLNCAVSRVKWWSVTHRHTEGPPLPHTHSTTVLTVTLALHTELQWRIAEPRCDGRHRAQQVSVQGRSSETIMLI